MNEPKPNQFKSFEEWHINWQIWALDTNRALWSEGYADRKISELKEKL